VERGATTSGSNTSPNPTWTLSSVQDDSLTSSPNTHAIPVASAPRAAIAVSTDSPVEGRHCRRSVSR